MGNWSIGPIVGQYQPEDFTEKQSSEWAVIPVFNAVSPLIFKQWNPREVTLSFVVSSMGMPLIERVRHQGESGVPNARDQSNPEVVWAMLCAMMRPNTNRPEAQSYPPPIFTSPGGGRKDFDYPLVIIPGWSTGGNNSPIRAIIESASIKRTHIAGNPSRAVRAIITVTLKEYVTTRARERQEESEQEEKAKPKKIGSA